MTKCALVVMMSLLQTAVSRGETQATMKLVVDESRGTVDLLRGNDALVRAARFGAIVGEESVWSTDTRFARKTVRSTSNDLMFPGELVVVTCSDSEQRLRLESRVTLLGDRIGAVIEVVVTNTSKEDLVVSAA